MANFPLIVLMTDYGLADPFSGILKGVISRIAPEVAMIDLTHEIPHGDVLRGAINLWQARSYFPEGTIFLCVVDPGVGTTRRGILVNSGGYSFIGPDNGLFTFIYGIDFQVRELYNPAYFLPITSATFHGRDIFAPVAAYVARGVSSAEFGPGITNPARLPLPRLDSPTVGVLRGECLFADRFGNMLTSIGKFQDNRDSLVFTPWISVHPPLASAIKYPAKNLYLHLKNGRRLSWANTFAAVPEGDSAFLVGSSGLLEIVANQQSATNLLGLEAGEPVILKSEGDQDGKILDPGRIPS
ncbi:MAG TPA: SAM-dependent chlorinase/fluorinase [Patescibacteria group bacterium]|nr:SAM-dependent chlorinase/fluorinase [Patescibacteria group bacterium]